MKKKNLLTLGALCLSLEGEPGVPGTNGKTYKDVIVIHDNNLKNGDVTQSVFFVTEGAHDSVTFTFTPTNPEDNVVVNFEINGQVVEDLDPSATSYTIEDADDYKGSIQVQLKTQMITKDQFKLLVLNLQLLTNMVFLY